VKEKELADEDIIRVLNDESRGGLERARRAPSRKAYGGKGGYGGGYGGESSGG
jgi:hypothetical protein